MSDLSDFIVKNGVLTKYTGNDADVTLPDNVTSIGNWAFFSCLSLNSVTIPYGVTSIGNNAFYDCSNLYRVIIPNSVASIGESAFEGCTNLEGIIIPDSVTSIGDFAFSECPSLVIHTTAGSCAEKYAKENDIEYVIE